MSLPPYVPMKMLRSFDVVPPVVPGFEFLEILHYHQRVRPDLTPAEAEGEGFKEFSKVLEGRGVSANDINGPTESGFFYPCEDDAVVCLNFFVKSEFAPVARESVKDKEVRHMCLREEAPYTIYNTGDVSLNEYVLLTHQTLPIAIPADATVVPLPADVEKYLSLPVEDRREIEEIVINELELKHLKAARKAGTNAYQFPLRASEYVDPTSASANGPSGATHHAFSPRLPAAYPGVPPRLSSSSIGRSGLGGFGANGAGLRVANSSSSYLPAETATRTQNAGPTSAGSFTFGAGSHEFTPNIHPSVLHSAPSFSSPQGTNAQYLGIQQQGSAAAYFNPTGNGPPPFAAAVGPVSQQPSLLWGLPAAPAPATSPSTTASTPSASPAVPGSAQAKKRKANPSDGADGDGTQPRSKRARNAAANSSSNNPSGVPGTRSVTSGHPVGVGASQPAHSTFPGGQSSAAGTKPKATSSKKTGTKMASPAGNAIGKNGGPSGSYSSHPAPGTGGPSPSSGKQAGGKAGAKSNTDPKPSKQLYQEAGKKNGHDYYVLLDDDEDDD